MKGNLLSYFNVFLIIILIIIQLICIIFINNHIKYKRVILDDVKLKKIETYNNDIALMIEQSDGSYIESSELPTNMLFNYELSGCIDSKGNKITNSINYNVLTQFIKVKLNSNANCFIYFDKKPNTEDDIFISEIKYINNQNADMKNSTIILAPETTLKSNVTLSNDDKDSFLTYSITVYNSTDSIYYFDKVSYILGTDSYTNENISFEVDGISEGDLINSKETKTFTITFHYKNNILAENNNLLSSIDFIFNTRVNNSDDISNIVKIKEEDIKGYIDFTNSGSFEKLYGGNDGELKYTNDGAIEFGSNYPILYENVENQTIFSENISVYLTIMTDVMQPNNSTKYPIAIIYVGNGDGRTSSETTLWIGLYEGYLHIYSYRPSNLEVYTYVNYETIEKSFISYNMQEYNNKKVNLQVVSDKDGKTILYINGVKVCETDSGEYDGAPDYITIGDLRPMRGLKYEGNLYDYELYDRLLTAEEIEINWKYAKYKWDIE